MIQSLGNHYYKDDEKGYFYDGCDGKIYHPYMRYFESFEECKEDVEAEESYRIQASEMRWEYMCDW